MKTDVAASSRLLVGGDDTIAAVASAAGRSATALIRMSGPRAFAILQEVTGAQPPPPRVAALRTVFARSTNAEGEALDRCLVTVFPGPHSYTGEDVVEFSVHGGFMVPALVLSSLIARGVRQALPGEFTRRALLNGKMDLLQAEAVADLIDSRSRGAAAAALRHLDGGLTRRITELRSAILDLEALVAYDIDFPEEDDGPVDRARVWDACERVENQLESLMRTAAVGEILREGALVVIAGAPNTGKSSLFNALVGRRRALVADQPGTTRDAIEAVIDADSWTIRLVDTAGLRSTAELIERLGIEVSEEYLSQAQVVLVCGDTDELLAHAVTSVSELSSARLIGVSTKSDLHRSAPGVIPGGRLASVHAVSAQTGEGLKQLVSGICDVLASEHSGVDATAPLLLRTRHLRAVQEASEEMRHFADAVREENIPMSIAGTHLHSAALALESLIGVIQVDDVLDRVFSSFCVGK